MIVRKTIEELTYEAERIATGPWEARRGEILSGGTDSLGSVLVFGNLDGPVSADLQPGISQEGSEHKGVESADVERKVLRRNFLLRRFPREST